MCLRPLLSPQTLIGLKIIKVCFGKSLSKHMQETRKHENMPAKRKCREGKATEPSKLGKRKCSRRSVVRDEDLSDGEAVRIVFRIYRAAEENTLCPLLSKGACFAGEFECYKVKYKFSQTCFPYKRKMNISINYIASFRSRQNTLARQSKLASI